MKKTFWILVVGGILAGSAALAATGSSYVTVSSCTNVSGGIRIVRSGSSPYMLANGCRDAGHGLRNYYLTCTASNRYFVSWTEDCSAWNDTAKPSAFVSSDRSSYGKYDRVNIYVRGTDNVAVNKLDLYQDGVLVHSENSVGDFVYAVQGSQLPWNRAVNFYAKAIDGGGNVGYSGTISVWVNSGDTVAPVVQANGSVDKQGYYNISVAAADAQNYVREIDVYIDNIFAHSWVDNGSESSDNVSRTFFGHFSQTGSHKITATAKDSSDNAGSAVFYLVW